MKQLHKDLLPVDAPQARDPHHNGINEWAFYKKSFWHKSGTSDYWIESKHTHLTEKRLVMLHSLITQ